MIGSQLLRDTVTNPVSEHGDRIKRVKLNGSANFTMKGCFSTNFVLYFWSSQDAVNR